MLLTIPLLSQEWGEQIELSGIIEPNMVGIDLFANSEALFLVIQDNSNDIRLYKVNSSGGIHTGYPVTLSVNGEFPSITGDNNTVYVTYLSNDIIKTKYSSDGNWVPMEDFQATTGNQCNGIDSKYEPNEGLHIVWATGDIPIGEAAWYETYYIQYDDENNYLSGAYKQVTDWGLEVGGFPTIDYSPDRVHVGYTVTFSEGPPYYNGISRKRSRNYGPWASFVNNTLSTNTILNQVVVYDNKLYGFYFNNLYTLKLKHIEFTSYSWNSTSLDIESVDPQIFIGVAATANDRLNFAYYTYSQGLEYRYFDGTSFSDPVTITINVLEQERRFGFTSVSNDIYVIFKKNNFGKLQYVQFDAAPLTPANFAGTIYNNHPKMTWDRLEPDIEYFEIWWQIVRNIKNPGAWNLLYTTTNTYLIDYGVILGDGDYVNYKVRSKDYSDNYSSFTNIISYEFSGLAKQNIVNQSIEYRLFSNFPNPFNPSTQISYALAQDADVTLRVYDILGTQVAELVNEQQTAGSYEINFNSEGLASGVYIYRIVASNNGRVIFTDTKQMILLR